MKTINEQKDHNKNVMKAVAAGVAGAVAITGVAVAATIALKDKKTRGKVKEALTNVKDKAIDYVGKLKSQSTSLKAA